VVLAGFTRFASRARVRQLAYLAFCEPPPTRAVLLAGLLKTQKAAASWRRSSRHTPTWILPTLPTGLGSLWRRARDCPATVTTTTTRGRAESLALPCECSDAHGFRQRWRENTNSILYNPIWHRSQCFGEKWGARVLRVRSVSREEVLASVGVQGAWVGRCGFEADKGALQNR